eukprot:gene23264-30493_t
MELDTLTPELPALLMELGIKYDPDRLAEVLNKKWPQLGGFIASVAADYAVGSIETNMPKRAKQLRKLLGDLGPSFVKIGQALSARPDLLPKQYLETLSGLQDRLEPYPTEIAFKVIEDELGMPLSKAFAEISDKPVAAASLGQVYKGRLHTGEEVAIKVQRPNIGENIAVDMLLLRRLMSVVDINIPQISQPLVPLVDEFAGRLFAELDYVQEGHNCEKFDSLYSSMPRVRCPKIYWENTARRVLVMEWIEGVKLTNKPAMDAGLSIVDFVNVGIECTLRQLLEHGYFHADPHPGNLLATKSGDLVYLDFGMMSEAPEYARYAIIAHVVHLVNRDYDAMCKDYYTLQFMDRSVDTSPIAPALAGFFDDVLDSSVSQLNFKAIVDGLGGILFQYPFRVPAYYALILRSLTVLEGLALSADSEYKLLAKAYPYMAKRLLTDNSPELRASLEDLVIEDGKIRWNRVENLMREGSRSQDYDPAELWLLADWLMTPNASSVRNMVVKEMTRMVDAYAADTMRKQIERSIGSRTIAERLVPVQPMEQDSLHRAGLFMNAASSRMGDGKGSDEPYEIPFMEGTGPMGVPSPNDIQAVIRNFRQATSEMSPRMQHIMQQPGSNELINNITNQLVQRFTARVIKFAFGIQMQVAAGMPSPAMKGAEEN